MIRPIVQKIVPVFLIICSSFFLQAQPAKQSSTPRPVERVAKPYQILTVGKQITIKSTNEIKSLMVWTSGGNRVLEEKNVNASQYIFRITIRENIFFIMIRLADGRMYSEKIGIQ